MAVLLAFVTSAVAIGVQIVALLKGNPRRFEVIQKTDPKARKTSLVTALDHGASTGPERVVLIPEPVILVPEPVESSSERSRNVADGR